jgi:hypothetical protein
MAIAAAVACLGLGAATGLAQDNNAPPPGGPPPGGPGGRGGWRNMDPAQRQQMMMDNLKTDLEITDDGEWNAIQPLLKNVMEAQQTVMRERMGGMFRRFRRSNQDAGGPGPRPGGRFGQPSPETEALQRAVDSKASTAETKAALAKFIDARKASEANLEKAQAELRKVLNVRQEAILTLRGML